MKKLDQLRDLISECVELVAGEIRTRPAMPATWQLVESRLARALAIANDVDAELSAGLVYGRRHSDGEPSPTVSVEQIEREFAARLIAELISPDGKTDAQRDELRRRHWRGEIDVDGPRSVPNGLIVMEGTN